MTAEVVVDYGVSSPTGSQSKIIPSAWVHTRRHPQRHGTLIDEVANHQVGIIFSRGLDRGLVLSNTAGDNHEDGEIDFEREERVDHVLRSNHHPRRRSRIVTTTTTTVLFFSFLPSCSSRRYDLLYYIAIAVVQNSSKYASSTVVTRPPLK